jgi:D-3-phosphoglycerate dehydrogenase / 2-oxoglutarate reductase
LAVRLRLLGLSGTAKSGCPTKIQSQPNWPNTAVLEHGAEENLKIVITDYRFPDVDQERRAVEAAGGNLVAGQATNEQEVSDLCRDADGVLTARAPITRRAISAMQRCRIIVRYGIGVDTVDVAAATERGILVANVPDYCLDEVSDHALTLLLMLGRQMISAISLAREDTWAVGKMPPLQRLRGQTCGLIGCGRIGSLLAGKVAPLGMRVVIHDPYLSEPRAREMGAELVSLDALLSRADFISLHAPLKTATHHLLGEVAFAKMKKTASVINTARGGLIDEAALLAALDAGKISGAALDVLESETGATPVRSALVRHPKMIVTAHTAWLSEQARATLQLRAIEQVLACLKGETPCGLINRELAK